jgi:hypothetical protein
MAIPDSAFWFLADGRAKWQFAIPRGEKSDGVARGSASRRGRNPERVRGERLFGAGALSHFVHVRHHINLIPNDPDNDDIAAFFNFMSLLAPPPRVGHTSATKSGAKTFVSIGCANCHLPVLQTGPSAIAALNNVTFFPYSDFLLHDMGSLGDGIAQSRAGPTEMRTAPLWGARVMTRFLHDGRATTLSQALLAHAGQGLAARNQFARLNKTDQSNLIAFLNSL